MNRKLFNLNDCITVKINGLKFFVAKNRVAKFRIAIARNSDRIGREGFFQALSILNRKVDYRKKVWYEIQWKFYDESAISWTQFVDAPELIKEYESRMASKIQLSPNDKDDEVNDQSAHDADETSKLDGEDDGPQTDNSNRDSESTDGNEEDFIYRVEPTINEHSNCQPEPENLPAVPLDESQSPGHVNDTETTSEKIANADNDTFSAVGQEPVGNSRSCVNLVDPPPLSNQPSEKDKSRPLTFLKSHSNDPLIIDILQLEGESLAKFKCAICENRTFRYMSAAKRHSQIHMEPSFKCRSPHCPAKFHTKYDMKSHYERMHRKLK